MSVNNPLFDRRNGKEQEKRNGSVLSVLVTRSVLAPSSEARSP